MTRKKFVKQLMALGVSRNTATAAADAASRAEIPLIEIKCRVQTLRRLWERELSISKRCRKMFDRALLNMAQITPRRIRPIAKKNRRLDGLRIDFAMVDEVSQWPKENPHLGGGRHD